jgi:ribosome-associated protein
MQHLEFDLAGEFIELSKLLKVTGVCESGGAAKTLISSGEVTVNGEIELRKGCKIRPGQTVQTGDVRITVRAAAQ